MKNPLNKINIVGLFNKKENEISVEDKMEMIRFVYNDLAYENLDHYMKDRRELNMLIISELWGIKVKKVNNVPHIKFRGKSITAQRFSELQTNLTNFIENVEKPLMGQFKELTHQAEEMEIPFSVYEIQTVPKLEKVTEKILDEIVFGHNGRESILNIMIDINDLVELMKLGEVIKMKKEMKKKIIIGTLVVVAVAGGGYAYYRYDKKKKEEALLEVEVDVIDDMTDINDDMTDIND